VTCICAIIENGVPHFAADSLLVSVPGSPFSVKGSQTIRREPKVFQNNGLLFGIAGSARMGQLLAYVFEPPEYIPGQDKVRYMVSRFVKALQECFDKEKFTEDDRWKFLLALEGELFEVDNDFAVCNTAATYEAVGLASDVALGSLHTTAQLGLPVRDRLYLALAAAEYHTCAVGEPFTYITTGMEQAELLPPPASRS
jgi:hypothetical protein